jgi:hypothetical protein
MTVWRMNRMVDLPWQSTNKRSLETVMFRHIAGLFEMAVCCAKPPYLNVLIVAKNIWSQSKNSQAGWCIYPGRKVYPPRTVAQSYLVRWLNRKVDLPWHGRMADGS